MLTACPATCHRTRRRVGTCYVAFHVGRVIRSYARLVGGAKMDAVRPDGAVATGFRYIGDYCGDGSNQCNIARNREDPDGTTIRDLRLLCSTFDRDTRRTLEDEDLAESSHYVIP